MDGGTGHQQQSGAVGLRVSRLSEANLNTTPHSSPSDKWINFDVVYEDGEMMQNDAPAVAPETGALTVVPINRSAETNATTGTDFRQMLHELEELKEKPLFSEDELEEATEEDDLFDDEDYDLEEIVRRHKQRMEEMRRKAGFVDDDDDDYYDDYSAEETEEEKKRAQAKQAKDGLLPVAGGVSPGGADDSVMQDYLSNIKSKSAPHRFKSKFDDFEDGDRGDGEGDLLSGGSNRKLRKNDSIKIISTPNGKVGIVYKVEPKTPEDDTGKGASAMGGVSGGTAGASEPRQNKITPVITADGKVALLYRGAADNGDTFRNKYEPITAKDILQLIDNNNNSNGSTTTTADGAPLASGGSVGSSNTNSSIKNITNNNIYNSHKNYDNSYDSFNRKSNVIVDSDQSGTRDDSRENNAASGGAGLPTASYPWATTTPMTRGVVRTTPTTTVTPVRTPLSGSSTTPSGGFFGGVLDPARSPFDGAMTPGESPDRQAENSLLINRPLSEVLGIRKNQYLEANTIKIPNIETSTNKMRITNNNNLLSSLLHNLYHGTATNDTGHHRTHPQGQLADHRNTAYEEEEHRRTGYSVNGFSRSRFYINRRTTPALPPRVIKEESEEEETVLTGADNDNALPEVVNLAIIPAFEHEIDEKYIRTGHGSGDFHRGRHRHQYNVAPGQPAVHCAMQALVACAVMATFFGIVGTYFRSRVVDHIRVLYW